MKIVFLNTLNAELKEPLKEFLQKHKDDTDVFCFQECYDNARSVLAEMAQEFTALSATKFIAVQNEPFTNITLVRKTFTVDTSSSSSNTTATGLCLFSTISNGDTIVHIANIHGLSKPGKLDNPARIQQSQEMLQKFAPLNGIQIIGGDFNVLPETQSVQLFEEAGYANLIKDFDIKTTRNEIAWAKYPGNELYYSDYVFIKGAKAASFEVPAEIVSDHQPMILTVHL